MRPIASLITRGPRATPLRPPRPSAITAGGSAGLLGLLSLLGLLGLLLLATTRDTVAEDDFLHPEQAFPLEVLVETAERLLVRWNIAEGYYLYQSKLRFATETVGIQLETPELPEAEIKNDRDFGQVPVYRGQLDLRLPLRREPGSDQALDLRVSYQGCADGGLCYPPQHQEVRLTLPALDTATPAVASATPAAAAAADAPAQIPAERPNLPTTADPLAAPASALQPGGPSHGVASRSVAQSLGLGDEEEILPAEEAFLFQAEVVAPDAVRLTFDIAPGTYLYRHLVETELSEAAGVAIGRRELPPGDIKKDSPLPDGTIGDVAVYHDQVVIDLPLLRSSAAPTQVTLIAKYQGCADIGICYPPQRREVVLSLPEATPEQLVSATALAEPTAAASATAPTLAAAGANAGLGSAAAPRSEQDRIAAVIAGGNLWLIVAAFFGFGLLLAFTPCVFPMIPILSGIIAGQGSQLTTRKAFVLSLVYVLAMALTYTVVGVLAGLFGANLQAVFQDPLILSTFALVFVLLALSMFGFYELQLPSALQSRLAELSNRQEGGTLIGVAIMGLLSALIVGPCVAPPLFGALIYISQTGDALLGGIALFALSMGMGAPLIAIGTSAGKLLPRAGAWMDAVKAVFGVTLLGVAILMLERILPAAVAMLLWGLLLICSAVYLGALNQLPANASGWSKLWKGLGLVLLIYGALMLVGTAAGGKDTLQPLRGLVASGSSGAAAHATFAPIKTSADLDAALTRAQTEGRPVMLDFYADWCVSCKEMERYTFSDPEVIAELQRFTLLRADVTANDADDRALLQERFGIPGPPAILFFDPTGAELAAQRLVGFKPADAFLAHLRGIAP